MTSLDEALPEFHFRERHARHIAAPAERVDEAVRAVTIGDMPMARLLFGLRAVPARLLGRSWLEQQADAPLLGYALTRGFGLLGDEPGREVAVGLIGQPWKLAGGESRSFDSPADFVRFNQPGFAKAAMNFRFEPEGNGTRLTTETRVLATDPISRRRFRRYWLVIRPGSGLIRRAWLRAAARRLRE